MHCFHYSQVISAIISVAMLVGLFRAAHAEVGEAPGKQQPAATRCVAARGLPSHGGAWQLGIDRATGHRCWRLVGANKPHARIVPGAKSSPGPKSPAASPVPATPRARPVTAAAAVQAYGTSQPAEVLTGSVAKPSETLPKDPGQSPISTEAGAISTPDQVDRDELQPFDLSVAWAAGRSLMGNIGAEIATYADPANLSADNILEHASALIWRTVGLPSSWWYSRPCLRPSWRSTLWSLARSSCCAHAASLQRYASRRSIISRT